MKRRITLSIALVVSIVLASLTNSDSRTNAAPPQRFIADTGVVTLGPDQELILTVLSGTPTMSGTFNFRIRRMNYMQESCNGGVCRLAVESQTTSDVITLMPGEAASILVASTLGRGIVLGDSQDMRVNAVIRNTVTGEVVACVDVVIDVTGN